MGAILTHPLSEEGSQAQVWALRILGGGTEKIGWAEDRSKEEN